MKAKQLFDATADLSEDERYFAALIIMQAKAWAYYAVLLNLTIVWTHKVSTAGTDGVYIYINPDFFLRLPSDGQRAFLLAHEVGHVVLRHPQRSKFYRKKGFHSLVGNVQVPYDPRQYNIDEDKVINADLIAHGFEFIDMPGFRAILDPKVSRDALVDEVYVEGMLARKMTPEPEPPTPDRDGDDDDEADEADDEADSSDSSDDEADESDESDESGDAGDAGDSEDEDGDEADDEAGAGDSADDEADESAGAGTADDMSDADDSDAPVGSNHGADDHFEPVYEAETEAQAEAWEQQDIDEIERKVDDALDMAEEMRQRGEHPGGTGHGFGRAGFRHGDAGLGNVEWREAMADWLTRRGLDGDVDWSRPNRRRLAILGTVVPSRKGVINRIVFGVDLSGSISMPQLQQVMDNLASCIDLIRPTDGVTIIWFTTKIERVDEIFTGQELLELQVPYAGGAELPSLVLDYIEENGILHDALVIFTDGYLTINAATEWQRLAEVDALVICSAELYGSQATYARKAGARTIIAIDENTRRR